MSTLRTSASRARYWRETERRRNVWIQRETNKAAQRFDEEGAYVGHLALRFGIAAALLGVLAQTPHWANYLHSLYMAVGTDFAIRTFDQLAAALPTASRDEERRRDEELRNMLYSALLISLFRQDRQKAREITQTTHDELQSTLHEGAALGESREQLQQRVTNQYSQWRQTRALTIARTEVVSASNLGSYEAAHTTVATLDLTLSKVWVATVDNRTRPWHLAADGQRVGINEYFVVEGEQLLYPGDWAHGASPDNLINCRCVVGYDLREARQRRAA